MYKQKLFDIKKKRHVCLKGEKVLFVRHPILRLISAWNDKFSLRNNNVKSGLEYGVRLLRGWRNSFPDDYEYLVKVGLSEPHRKTVPDSVAESNKRNYLKLVRQNQNHVCQKLSVIGKKIPVI